MAYEFKNGTAARNAAASATGTLLNNGNIPIYDDDGGGLPANPQASVIGNLLATPTFGATAFGSPSTGVITANAIGSDTNAAASGTATYGRVRQSDNTVVGQGNAGDDDEAFIFDNPVIVATGTVAITALTYTYPE
jgi:hypothetical protein